MNKEELLSEDNIKKNVPQWVLSAGYTLLFLSVFINSVGLNLMQINGALTENIVTRLEHSRLGSGSVDRNDNKNKNNYEEIKEIRESLEKAATKEEVAAIIERLKALEAVSHKPARVNSEVKG